jgi:hypothetical protein
VNYQDNRALFWINLIGHEAMSVLSLVETNKSFSGTAEQIGHVLQLRTNKMDTLKLLDAFGLISMSKVKKIITVYSTGVIDIPGWGVFVQQLSEALRTTIKKKDVTRINWQSAFAAVDAATDQVARVGLQELQTVEVVVRNDKGDPRLIVNGNQKPNGSGFSFVEIIRGEFTCVCSHRIGEGVAPAAPTLRIRLKPAVIEQEVTSAESYHIKPVDKWNAVDLSSWIMDKFFDAYGSRPPFNRMDVQNNSIMKEGVYALARQKRLDETEYMPEFKRYVEWLCGHKTFDLTLSALTSSKTMQIFCVEQMKKQSKKTTSTVGVPTAQNLPS